MIEELNQLSWVSGKGIKLFFLMFTFIIVIVEKISGRPNNNVSSGYNFNFLVHLIINICFNSSLVYDLNLINSSYIFIQLLIKH